jgi:hypothetical protein
MTTLQQRYASIVRQVFDLSLKQAGYRRRGANCYKFISGDIAHFVGFQRSVYSSSYQTSFTVNVGVYRKGIWAVLVPNSPEPRIPSVSNCIIQERLGCLTPAGLDKWWDLADSDAPQRDRLVVDEVCTALDAYGLPFLDAFRDDEAILQFVLDEVSPRYPLLETIRAAVLACVAQRKDTASYLLKIVLEKSREASQGWLEWALEIARQCAPELLDEYL